MKKALTIILVYILICVLGTAALAVLFMFNADMLSYVTDLPSKLFSIGEFLYGVALSFPLICCVALFSVVLLMARNRENQILSFIVYLCLGALAWLFFIPFSLGFLSDLNSKNEGRDLQRQTTSAGIFRKDDSGVYYNSRILQDGNADGIFIDTSGFSEDGEIVSYYDSPVNNDAAFPYSDILVKNALEPPKYVTYPLEVYTSLLTAAENSNSKGVFSWLFFASLGLALLATYGLHYFSSWRLCSVLSVAVGQILVVFLNYFYYMGFIPSGLKELESMISKVVPADNSLIFVTNFLVAVLFAVFGIVMGIYRNQKAKIGRNGEIQ